MLPTVIFIAVLVTIAVIAVYSQLRLTDTYKTYIGPWLQRGCDPVRLRNWKKRKPFHRLKPWSYGRKLRYGLCVMLMGFCWLYQGERLPHYVAPEPLASISFWGDLPNDSGNFKPEWRAKPGEVMDGVYLAGQFLPMYLGKFVISVNNRRLPGPEMRLEMNDHVSHMEWLEYREGKLIKTVPFNPRYNTLYNCLTTNDVGSSSPECAPNCPPDMRGPQLTQEDMDLIKNPPPPDAQDPPIAPETPPAE